MSSIATDKRQLTLIYNSETRLGKQAYGYVQAADDRIRTVDISKDNLGDTVWVSVADGLKKPFDQILSKDHPDAPDVDHSNFDTDDWLKLLKKNPKMLQHPIAINGEDYMQLETPSHVLKFFDVDSAGLTHPPLGEQPPTEPKDDEPFV